MRDPRVAEPDEVRDELAEGRVVVDPDVGAATAERVVLDEERGQVPAFREDVRVPVGAAEHDEAGDAVLDAALDDVGFEPVVERGRAVDDVAAVLGRAGARRARERADVLVAVVRHQVRREDEGDRAAETLRGWASSSRTASPT